MLGVAAGADGAQGSAQQDPGGSSNEAATSSPASQISAASAASPESAAGASTPAFPIFPLESHDHVDSAPKWTGDADARPAAEAVNSAVRGSGSDESHADTDDAAQPPQQKKRSRLRALLSVFKHSKRRSNPHAEQPELTAPDSSDAPDAGHAASSSPPESPDLAEASGSNSCSEEAADESHAETLGGQAAGKAGPASRAVHEGRRCSNSSKAGEGRAATAGQGNAVDWAELNASMMQSLHAVITGIVTTTIARVPLSPVFDCRFACDLASREEVKCTLHIVKTLCVRHALKGIVLGQGHCPVVSRRQH